MACRATQDGNFVSGYEGQHPTIVGEYIVDSSRVVGV